MSMYRRMILATGMACMVAIAGCSNGMSGTYTDSNHLFTFNFHSNGLVDIQTMNGQIVEAHYEVKKDRIVLSAKGQPNTILKKRKDGKILFMNQPLTRTSG